LQMEQSWMKNEVGHDNSIDVSMPNHASRYSKIE